MTFLLSFLGADAGSGEQIMPISRAHNSQPINGALVDEELNSLDSAGKRRTGRTEEAFLAARIETSTTGSPVT